jgi:hypothetical protein
MKLFWIKKWTIFDISKYLSWERQDKLTVNHSISVIIYQPTIILFGKNRKIGMWNSVIQ